MTSYGFMTAVVVDKGGTIAVDWGNFRNNGAVAARLSYCGWGRGPPKPATAITRSDVCVTGLKQRHLATAALRFAQDEAMMPVVFQQGVHYEIEAYLGHAGLFDNRRAGGLHHRHRGGG
jgi:hypothetical protein